MLPRNNFPRDGITFNYNLDFLVITCPEIAAHAKQGDLVDPISKISSSAQLRNPDRPKQLMNL